MQKIWTSLFILTLSVWAGSNPPMPPMSTMQDGKQEREQKLKAMLPKECQTLPPMLILLPPPMQKEMTSCKNAFHFPKPDKKGNFQKIFGEKATITNITIVQGFNRLYAVEFTLPSWLGEDKKTAYCNSDLTSCIEGNLKK